MASHATEPDKPELTLDRDQVDFSNDKFWEGSVLGGNSPNIKLDDGKSLANEPRYSVSPLQCTLAYLLLAAVRAVNSRSPPSRGLSTVYSVAYHALYSPPGTRMTLSMLRTACHSFSITQVCLVFWALQKNFPDS